MKLASDIVKFGRVKKFVNDIEYQFASLDLETVNNELFLIGTYYKKYTYTLNNFFEYLNDFFINCVRNNHDILTWSRYDNTFLVKEMLKGLSDKEQIKILQKVGKITPLYKYTYKGFSVELTNIIKENIVLTINALDGSKKRLIIYNLKNLFTDDLENTAKDYHLNYYSKLGLEYHIIDKNRFETDKSYNQGVVKSNYLDNIVLIDIAYKLLENFKAIAGIYPKTIYTAGSLARSYLLSLDNLKFNLKAIAGKSKLFEELLSYSMASYHGGKIESYGIGFIPHAKTIDISSAYPYAMSQLPRIKGRVKRLTDLKYLDKYFYAFMNCTIYDLPENLIHPVIVPSPINIANISPCGTFDAIITKIEYQYLIDNHVRVEVKDFIAIENGDDYPYYDMIHNMFNQRMKTKKTNPSLSSLYKLILNSLYGITFELNDIFIDNNDEPQWEGYRAGDFFNPVIASYITAITRTTLSHVDQHIINNGGEVYLNMTDSIIYNGEINLDIFSSIKKLGTFEPPEKIKDLIILGAGRYEYKNEFTNKYTIRSRGFSVNVKDKAYYSELDLDDDIKIDHRTFVSYYKATGLKFKPKQLGHLINDEYIIDPFNLGGKRIINNLKKIDLKREYLKSRPLKLEKDIIKLVR